MSYLNDPSNQISIQYNPNTQASLQESNRRIDSQQIGNYSGAIQRCLRNFILGKKIGAGTFSKVCIAKHKLTNQQVAIKIIQKNKIENDADKDRLNRQIKIMRKVRHPCIAQLYQIIETNKYIYLVMEYAARGQLFQHIVSHQRLNQFQASKFLLQLIDAVEYLHQMGVAHRDLKPQNLLLDQKYNIKVTDFGLSNIYPAGKELITACGSPSYACPEMLSGKPYDGLKADIWSVGIILYAMCFGYLPFDNPNISQLYKLIKKGKYDVPEFASLNLIEILQRILQVDPNQRATISQIRNHPFCKFSITTKTSIASIPGIIFGLSQIPYEISIQNQMKNQLHLNVDHLRQQIKNNKHNQNTCTYYLLLQRQLRSKNQTLSNYYASKYNTINRYALVERVKANIQRRQLTKMEIKKFHAVKEEIKKRNKGSQSFHVDRSGKKSSSPKTILKETHSGTKVVHSAQNQKPTIFKQNLTEQQQMYLRSSNMKHFAPNNTKFVMTESKLRKNKKNRSKSQSQNKTRKSKSSTNLKKNKDKTKKSSPQKSNYLQVPRSNEKKSTKNSPVRSSSNKKSKASSSGKKNSTNKKQNQEQTKRKRNKSLPQGIKLKF